MVVYLLRPHEDAAMRLSLLLPVLSSSRLVMLKLAIFDKTGFWGLKYPPEVRVEQKTCSTICGTPAPAILIDKNSTGLAGGARKGQNMARKCPKMNGHTLRPWFPADNLQRGPKTGVMGKKLLNKLPCCINNHIEQVSNLLLLLLSLPSILFHLQGAAC